MHPEDMWLYMIIPVMFAAQLGMCLLCKRVWLRLIPTLVSLLLIVACFVAYAASAFTNWAFLILGMIMFFAYLACGLAWAIFGIINLIKKLCLSRKNT